MSQDALREIQRQESERVLITTREYPMPDALVDAAMRAAGLKWSLVTHQAMRNAYQAGHSAALEAAAKACEAQRNCARVVGGPCESVADCIESIRALMAGK